MSFRAMRERAGMTQEEAAEEFGTYQHRISDYERGRIIPRVDTMIRLMRLYDCTADELLEGQYE